MQTEVISTNWTDHATFAQDVFNAFVRIGLPPQAAALFTAHSALSTGWGKSVYNWNLAGLKLCGGCEETYDWHYALGSEAGDVTKSMMKWRSFNTIDEGVQALWANLQADRYASARALLLAGDPEYFAEVGRNGWYTANPAQMKAEMSSNLKYIAETLGLTLPAGGGLVELATGIGVAYGVYWLLRKYA